jgi:hypothetical protein
VRKIEFFFDTRRKSKKDAAKHNASYEEQKDLTQITKNYIRIPGKLYFKLLQPTSNYDMFCLTTYLLSKIM